MHYPNQPQFSDLRASAPCGLPTCVWTKRERVCDLV